ncbi:MAG: DUF1918 domain-containing protein [Actinomycetota bacterium]
MPKVGDRVIIEGTKIGNPRREGSLIGVVGPLINVRWSDGTTSLFKPGAGAVRFEPKTGKPKVAPAAKTATTGKAVKSAKPAAKTTATRTAVKPAKAAKTATKSAKPATKKPAKSSVKSVKQPTKKPAKKATKKR